MSGVTTANVYRFLLQCKLGVLATVDAVNKPQSALVGIAVTEKLEIIFDTLTSSRKYSNLIACPSCSLVIGWTEEQTVQYEGQAAVLVGYELERYQRVYFEAWPECRSHLTWPEIVYFVVRPQWIRYSDFGQQPAVIQEFRM